MHRRSTRHAERVEIVERHLEGQSLPAVAEAMGISYYTARKWWLSIAKKAGRGCFPSPSVPQ